MFCNDMAKSIEFYRDKLGFKTKEKGNNPPVIFFDTPGTKFEYKDKYHYFINWLRYIII